MKTAVPFSSIFPYIQALEPLNRTSPPGVHREENQVSRRRPRRVSLSPHANHASSEAFDRGASPGKGKEAHCAQGEE